MRLVCCLVLLLGGLQLACALLVGAWNIENFGRTKAAKPDVMKHIADVVRRYDVIVIQEVRDSDNTMPVINTLMDLLNPKAPTQPTGKKNQRVKINPPVRKTITKNGGSSVYAYIESKPLPLQVKKGGRQERYVYIYKTTTVNFRGRQSYSFQYPEVQQTTNPKFSRPPFVVMFRSKAAVPFDFVMIPLHAVPTLNHTVAEINALADVVQDATAKWNTQKILLLGDFNAGGTYLPGGENDTNLNEANGYKWLIPDSACSNFGITQCAYDRIVATTSMMLHVVADSAKVYKFEVDLGLTPKTKGEKRKALAVSNHSPVEVELR